MADHMFRVCNKARVFPREHVNGSLLVFFNDQVILHRPRGLTQTVRVGCQAGKAQLPEK
jgi:hypothetical protein